MLCHQLWRNVSGSASCHVRIAVLGHIALVLHVPVNVLLTMQPKPSLCATTGNCGRNHCNASSM